MSVLATSRRLRRTQATCAMVVAVLALRTGSIAAQDGELAPIELVEHDAGDGVARCPDASTLQARIAALRASDGALPAHPLRIDLVSTDGNRQARLSSAEDAGVRTLDLAGLSCAQALEVISVAAVMLLDEPERSVPDESESSHAEAVRAEPAAQTPEPAMPAPSTPAAIPMRVAPAESNARGLSIWLVGVAAPSWGLVHGLGFAGALGVEVASSSVALGLRGELSTTSQQALGASAAVQTQLLTAELSACARSIQLLGQVNLRTCGLLALGRLDASPLGDAGTRDRSLLWLAAGAGLGLEGPFARGRLGWLVHSTRCCRCGATRSRWHGKRLGKGSISHARRLRRSACVPGSACACASTRGAARRA